MARMPNIYRGTLGGPLRWQDDVTGVLPEAVRAYLSQVPGGAPITSDRVELVRDYLEYCINAPCWDTETMESQFADLRERVKTLCSADEIDAWISSALDVGIDPL